MNAVKKRVIVIGAIGALGVGVLTGCTPTAAAPEGVCGFVVGDGQNGNDRKIHEIVYEGQNPTYDRSTEELQYVPCGPRNYLVTDGSELGLNGQPIGDLTTPFQVVTAGITPVNVQVDAFWQLNQSEDALRNFKELCNKYTCYSTDTGSGTANFATEGWNGMLQENFRPSMNEALKIAMSTISDDIWSKQDQTLYSALEEAMSAAFMDTVRTTTGYNTDLFCGSGNSDWSNPDKPGEGEFTCSNVRFEVRSVEAASSVVQDSASAQSQEQLAIAANQSRYNSAVVLYGSQTNFWLGVQDAVAKCPSGATCNIYVGDPNQ